MHSADITLWTSLLPPEPNFTKLLVKFPIHLKEYIGIIILLTTLLLNLASPGTTNIPSRHRLVIRQTTTNARNSLVRGTIVHILNLLTMGIPITNTSHTCMLFLRTMVLYTPTWLSQQASLRLHNFSFGALRNRRVVTRFICTLSSGQKNSGRSQNVGLHWTWGKVSQNQIITHLL